MSPALYGVLAMIGVPLAIVLGGYKLVRDNERQVAQFLKAREDARANAADVETGP